jgi:hypothetical protein
VFLQNRRPQYVETKKLKDPLAVEVEYSQIVGFMKIVFDHLKMPAVALLGERERDLEGNKLANSPGFKRVEELRVAQGFVRREDQQGPLAVSSRSDFIEDSPFAPSSIACHYLDLGFRQRVASSSRNRPDCASHCINSTCELDEQYRRRWS